MSSKAPSFREAFRGRVNVPHETIYRNIRRNIRRQLSQLQAYPPNDYKILLLCGGPSLAEEERRIIRLYKRGWKIATVNGTHRWALERGMKPSVHMMLDARSFNVEFVQNAVPTCKYLICSQCDPWVYGSLIEQGIEPIIWHGANPDEPDAKILNRYYRKRWQPVFGGSSIGTKAMGILYLLGVRSIRIFGMDSSLKRSKHHAYPQSENDAPAAAAQTVQVGRRRFKSYVWMLAQLDDFLQMAPSIPDDLNWSLEGDGLLQYVVSETRRTRKPPDIRLVGKKDGG